MALQDGNKVVIGGLDDEVAEGSWLLPSQQWQVLVTGRKFATLLYAATPSGQLAEFPVFRNIPVRTFDLAAAYSSHTGRPFQFKDLAFVDDSTQLGAGRFVSCT